MLLSIINQFHFRAFLCATAGNQRVDARAYAHFQAHFLPLSRQERAQRSKFAPPFISQQVQPKLLVHQVDI